MKSIKIMAFLLFYFNLTTLSKSEVISYQILNSVKHPYEFKDVCHHFNMKHIIMAEPKGLSQIDCMGKVISVKDFCLQKWNASHSVLRGYVSEKEKKVVCQLGERVVLKYKCNKVDSFCQSSLKGCNEIKEILSYQLPLIHDSKISDQTLNCIFEKEERLDNSKLLRSSIL